MDRIQEAAEPKFVPPASEGLQSLSKESDMVSRKRKAAVVEEEGLNSSDMDGLAATKEKSTSGEGMSNALLGELHLQRMARINNSMASSDLEKNSQENLGQASGLASDSSVRNRSVTSADPLPTTDTDPVVILTYNVWFREDLELQARMNAIGKIIQLHQPHVICLQEVTPNIYSILQKSSWWSLYKCSVTSALAAKRAYFCVQVASPFFPRNPYNNSIMGRELAMADLDPGHGEQLVVATTHLESPCPAPPTWNQMFSKERVIQAKEALNLMRDLPNVVFGGDMNWDDKQDGQPPCQKDGLMLGSSCTLTSKGGWFLLMWKQPGLTYDTKANAMLSGNRLLQKRLDRMFCQLRDFKVESIEMVGMHPIPGLSFQKERKGKSGQVQLTCLPVLPSDHFGLLVKLERICA